jgi:hypothetical protein
VEPAAAERAEHGVIEGRGTLEIRDLEADVVDH